MMNRLPKYIALVGENGLYLNGQTLEMELSPFSYRTSTNAAGHIHLQGLSVGVEVNKKQSSEQITLYSNERVWAVEQIGNYNGFFIKDTHTNQFLAASGNLQDLPYKWSIENTQAKTADFRPEVNVYVVNTYNVAPPLNKQLTPEQVQLEAENRAQIQDKIHQLLNEAGKEGMTQWQHALLPPELPLAFLSNEANDSIILFYSTNLSEEALALLPKYRQPSEFSQIIIKYLSSERSPIIELEQKAINYTTLLIENPSDIPATDLLQALQNGYQTSAALSYQGKMSTGLTQQDAIEISDNMESAHVKLKLNPLDSLDNRAKLNSASKQEQTTGSNINSLVNSFIPQVTAAAISATSLFVDNKAFVIDVRLNNYSDKVCGVSIQHCQGLTSNNIAIDSTAVQTVKAASIETENLDIPGLSMSLEDSNKAIGYADYVLTNQGYLLESCAVLLVCDFEGTEEKLFVRINVPMSRPANVNAAFATKGACYKDIFNHLSICSALQASVVSNELELMCDVTLNHEYNAPDNTYVAIVNLRQKQQTTDCS